MAQFIAQYVNPVMNALKGLGGSGQPGEVCAAVAEEMRLKASPNLEENLKSGVFKFENHVAWVRQHLVWAGYIGRSKRGVWTLTEKGRNAKTLSDAEVNEVLSNSQRQSRKLAKLESDQLEDADEPIPEESGYKERLLAIIGQLPPKRL